MATAPQLIILVVAIAVASSSSWCHVASYALTMERSGMLRSGTKHRRQKHLRRTTDFCNGIFAIDSDVQSINVLKSHTLSSVGDVDVDHSTTIIPPSPTRSNHAPSKPSTQHHHLQLISLPYPTDNNEKSADTTQNIRIPAVESLLQKCWSWKDMALGDGANHIVPTRRQRRRRRRGGRVEFIPRSTAIRQFQMLFVGMEIVVVRDHGRDDDDGNAGTARVVLKTPCEKTGQMKSNEYEVDMPVPSNNLFEETSFTVEECSVLSTCSRLNVILVLRSKIDDSSSSTNATKFESTKKELEMVTQIASRHAVTYALLQQIQQQASQQKSTKEQRNDDNVQVADRLAHIEGSHSISSHLCLVASGLTPRPDRHPNSTDVLFRPYSSQDSHILMQLKRTVEIISVRGDHREAKRYSSNNDVVGNPRVQGSKQRRKTTSSRRRRRRQHQIAPGRIIIKEQQRKKVTTLDSPSQSSRGRIKTLLDGALRAGKAARNEGIVPEIAMLKQYCLDDDGIPPKELSVAATEAVMERAIAPSIESCVARLAAMDNDTAKQISGMRQRVHNIVDQLTEENVRANSMHCTSNNIKSIQDGTTATKSSSRLKMLANKLLHMPTVQLRQGKLSGDEMEEAVVGIEVQLREYCNDNGVLNKQLQN